MSGNSCCFNFYQYFPQNNSMSTKKSFLCFQIYCFCSKIVTMVTTKNMAVVFQMCQTIHPSEFRFVFGLQTEIFYIVYCLILQLSFVTSQNLLLFSFCKTSKKQHLRFFSHFFSENCPNLDT